MARGLTEADDNTQLLRAPAPKSSNRGKGYTKAQALLIKDKLSLETKDALGPGGQKVLNQLCEVAPGTFFHSLHVAKLMPKRFRTPECEAAILMHDVGKLVYHDRYAENVVGDSPLPEDHILLSHVSAGEVMAGYYNLSPLARNAIREHHGRLPLQGGSKYRGEIPQTMFTATLMMCDTIEALFSSNKLSEELVWNIFNDRITLKQFEKVDLTQLEENTKDILRRALRKVPKQLAS